MTKQWTDEEIAILLAHNENMKLDELSKLIGRHKEDVRNKLINVLKEQAKEKRREKRNYHILVNRKLIHRNYRTLVNRMSVVIREYRPHKRTIYFFDRAYHLQFPYVIMAKMGDHNLFVAFAIEPNCSHADILYRPPLPNFYDDRWSVCLGGTHGMSDLFDRFWMTRFNSDLDRRVAFRYFKSWYNWFPSKKREDGFRKWQNLNLRQVYRRMKKRARREDKATYREFIKEIGCGYLNYDGPFAVS